MFLRLLAKICPLIIRNELQVSKTSLLLLTLRLPATKEIGDVCTHAEKGRLRNSVANRVPASRWQGILFRINCEIISG